MLHYHGTPITPDTACLHALRHGHAFVSWARPDQLMLAAQVCQSFALDNGAFSAWRAGRPVDDWSLYYEWVGTCRLLPGLDFAVVPDVIDGSESDNDALLAEWPHPRWLGAPVWHMHESLDRLGRLASDWPRVCLGSSGQFARVGTAAWWGRMREAMDVVCNVEGSPLVRLHGLRMLSVDVFTHLPLASADSTNIARNIGIDARWKQAYAPPTKDMRAQLIRSRIEAHNAPITWAGGPDK